MGPFPSALALGQPLNSWHLSSSAEKQASCSAWPLPRALGFSGSGGVRTGGTPTAPHSEVARAGPAGHGCDTSDGKTAPGWLSETLSCARRCYEPDFGEVRFRKHHLGDLRFAFRGAVSSCSSQRWGLPSAQGAGLWGSDTTPCS